MIRLRHHISLLLLICLVTANVAPFGAPVLAKTKLAHGREDSSSAKDRELKNQSQGLRFRLSQAADQPEAVATPNITATEPLSESETANILSRLPPMKADASDEQEFKVRERSLPPPRTGKTISVAFPAVQNVAPPETGSRGLLEIVRYSPEGDVALAPNLM